MRNVIEQVHEAHSVIVGAAVSKTPIGYTFYISSAAEIWFSVLQGRVPKAEVYTAIARAFLDREETETAHEAVARCSCLVLNVRFCSC